MSKIHMFSDLPRASFLGYIESFLASAANNDALALSKNADIEKQCGLRLIKRLDTFEIIDETSILRLKPKEATAQIILSLAMEWAMENDEMLNTSWK